MTSNDPYYKCIVVIDICVKYAVRNQRRRQS